MENINNFNSVSIGQIVYVKRGRGKSNPFIVADLDKDFLYLVDGDTRKLEKPKKKNKKHIQIVNQIDYNIKKKLEEKLYLLDADIRKALKPYKNNSNINGNSQKAISS